MGNGNSSSSASWQAIILAADRDQDDSVAVAAGTVCKAFAPLAGKTMVIRVLEALELSRTVDKLVLSGPTRRHLQRAPALAARIQAGALTWCAPEAGPSASVSAALQLISSAEPVLVTTADHALLTAEMVDYFLTEVQRCAYDAAVALAPVSLVKAAYPNTTRTVTRFQDGEYCGCNLFAFLTPHARSAVKHWQQIEKQRKKPFRVIAVLGWLAVLRYLAGRLTLNEALEQLSRRMKMRIGAVILPFADAAVDVDTPADLQLVRATLQKREQRAAQRR